MDENPSPETARENLRLEIENARLTLERLRHADESYRTFLERWRTESEPLHEHRLMSREQAHQFARMAIQMMFWLNGGALVAFPAFAQLVGNGFRGQVALATVSIGAFVFGLVFIAVAAVAAYLSMQSDAAAVIHLENYTKYGISLASTSGKDKAELESKRTEEETNRARYFKRAWACAHVGLGFGIASLTAFVVGAYYAGRVLSGAQAVIPGVPEVVSFGGIPLM